MSHTIRVVIKPTTAHVFEDKDLFSKMDPYVIFKLDGYQKQKTKVHRSGGKRPVWKDEIEYDVVPGHSDMRVTLKDKDTFKCDDHIGSCNVDLLQATKLGKTDLWYELSRKGKKTGSIHLIIATKEYLLNNPYEINPKSASGNTHDNNFGVPQGAMEQAYGNGAYRANMISNNSCTIFEELQYHEWANTAKIEGETPKLILGASIPNAFAHHMGTSKLISPITLSKSHYHKDGLHSFSSAGDYCYSTRQ